MMLFCLGGDRGGGGIIRILLYLLRVTNSPYHVASYNGIHNVVGFVFSKELS